MGGPHIVGISVGLRASADLSIACLQPLGELFTGWEMGVILSSKRLEVSGLEA